MGKETNCTDFSFLKNTENVIKYINNHFKTENLRNSQVQAIASILIALDGYEKYYNFYSKYSSKKRDEINKTDNKNLTTAKESNRIPLWKDIRN